MRDHFEKDDALDDIDACVENMSPQKQSEVEAAAAHRPDHLQVEFTWV